MTVVVDASAVGAFLLPDEHEGLGRLAREVCRTERLHVPAIWRTEMASLLQKAYRRGRIDIDRLRLAAGEADVVASAAAIAPDLSIAEIVAGSTAHALKAYDYTYFALAQELACPLITADGPLRRAAAAAGLKLLLP